MADSGVLGTTAGIRGEARPARRTHRLRFFLMIALPALALAAGGFWWLGSGRYVSTDDAYVEADKLALSTDVSGSVATVDVRDNQPVKAGQILFRLDDTPFRIAVARAEAQLGIARESVDAMKAQYREQLQAIRLAQLDIAYETREFQRRAALYHSHVVAADQFDAAQYALDTATEKLNESQQHLAEIAADLGGGPDVPTDRNPQVLAAQAVLDQAKRDLNHCTVRAPADGIVSNVPDLRPGMYLPAATPAFSLVSTGDVWVTANPKESQLTWVRPGQPVTVTIDTYPGLAWQGRVASLSPASGAEFSVLPAENTSGNWVKVVQRIPIRIHLDPDPGKPMLRAGMSAVIDIDTGHRSALADFIDTFLGRPANAAQPR